MRRCVNNWRRRRVPEWWPPRTWVQMSWIKNIRDDVISAVTPLATGYTLKSGWVPELNRVDIDGKTLLVYPESRSHKIVARNMKRAVITVWVGLLAPLTPESNPDLLETALTEDATASETHEMAELLIDALLGNRLSGATRAMCTGADEMADGASTTNVEQWRELRQMASLIKFTFESDYTK